VILLGARTAVVEHSTQILLLLGMLERFVTSKHTRPLAYEMDKHSEPWNMNVIILTFNCQDSKQHHTQWDLRCCHRNKLGYNGRSSIWQRCRCSRFHWKWTTNNLGSAPWRNRVKGLLLGHFWRQCSSK
jgi:hypothetical protein